MLAQAARRCERERTNDELLDQIIADVSYIDLHGLPKPMLWVLADIVESFAAFVTWQENRKAE